MNKSTLLTSLLLLVSGCTSIGTTDIGQYDVTQSQTYAPTKEELWQATIEWLATQNVPLNKIEKESGLISSEYGLAATQAYLDCGKPTGNQGLYQAKFEGIFANLNIVIREATDGTRVTMNLFGNARVVLRDGITVRQDSMYQCVSTGRLEREFHSYLSTI